MEDYIYIFFFFFLFNQTISGVSAQMHGEGSRPSGGDLLRRTREAWREIAGLQQTVLSA